MNVSIHLGICPPNTRQYGILSNLYFPLIVARSGGGAPQNALRILSMSSYSLVKFLGSSTKRFRHFFFGNAHVIDRFKAFFGQCAVIYYIVTKAYYILFLPKNSGIGKWLYLKGIRTIGDIPFFTGGRVFKQQKFIKYQRISNLLFQQLAAMLSYPSHSKVQIKKV